MTYVPALNVCKVAVNQQLDGQNMVNVLHFKKGSTVTQSDLDNLAEAVGLWWADNVTPLQSQDASLISATAVDLTTQAGPESIATLVTPEVGGIATDTLPLNCAWCLTKRTAKRGRSFRGRTYIGGVPDSKADAGAITDANWILSLINNFTAALATPILTGFTQGVLSYFFNGAPLSAAEFTPINAYTGDSSLDSQRRRLLGRGT